MSWTELERLVDDVEADGQMQRALRHCRSRRELILAARRLGYRITRLDLQRAWQEEQQEQRCEPQLSDIPMAAVASTAQNDLVLW